MPGSSPQFWFPILVAAVLVGGGLVKLVKLIAFRRRGCLSDGVVVAITTKGRSSYPVLRFTTVNGRQVRTTANYAQSPAPWWPGQPVRVIYDPRKPERALIATTVRSSIIASVLLILLGGVLGAAFSMPALTVTILGGGR